MKIAVCDDEKSYVDIISDFVRNFFIRKNIEAEIYTYTDAKALLEAGINFDFVFLDIEMENVSGLEAAEEINRHNSRALIFIITSHQNYLDEAMDLNVFRYIDKPVNEIRFEKSLEKALEVFNNSSLSFKTDRNEIVTVDKRDIISAEIMGRKVLLHTLTEDFISKEKICFFKKNLTASYFIIPHNSYIVNMNYIIKYKRDTLMLKGSKTVPVAYLKQNEINKIFLSFLGEEYDEF